MEVFCAYRQIFSVITCKKGLVAAVKQKRGVVQ